MGVYGDDGADAAVILLAVHRENVWGANGKRGRVGVYHNGAAALYNDVLPRLRSHPFWRSSHS